MTRRKNSNTGEQELDLFASSDFEDEQASHKESEALETSPIISSDVNEDFNRLFDRLAQSTFRSRFYLNNKDKAYIQAKGLNTIRQHAADFIAKRLAPAYIPNDGKQTPMRHVHPVFQAQHATGCCCRGCLEKWHHIPKGRLLTPAEQAYIVAVIMEWIKRKSGSGSST